MNVCPRCGAPNPSEHKFCSQCGQRLVEATPPQPAAPPAEQADLPPWLAEQPSAAPHATHPAGDDVPEWLRDLTPTPPAPPATSAQAQQDLPAWLLEDTPGPEPAPTPPSHPTPQPQTDLPAWLIDPDVPPPLPPAPSTAELPPWLREADDDASAAPTTPSPSSADSAAGLPAGPATPPAPAETQEQPLPPWLRDDTGAPPAASAPTDSAAAALPAWLRDEAPDTDQPRATAAPATSAPAAGDELPAWLLEDMPPQNATPAPATPTSGEELPAWLRADETEPSPPPPSSAAADHELPAWLLEEPAAPEADQRQPTPTADADAAPDWLHELNAPEAAPATSAPAAGEELPAWLRTDETEPSPPPPSSAATDHELPAWLLEESPVGSAGTAPTEADSPATAASTAELPAWLLDEPTAGADHQAARDTGATAPPREDTAADAHRPAHAAGPDDELPAWLLEESPVGAEAAGVTPPAQAEHETAPPAWLSEEPQPATGTTPTAQPSPGDATTAELPAWLLELPEATASAAAPTPHVDTSTSAAQDQAVPTPHADTFTSAAQDQATLPPWLAGMEQEPTPASSATDGELPPWLNEPEATPAAARPAATDSSLIGELDLPAWLREESPAPPPTQPPAPPAPEWLQRIVTEPDEEQTTGTAVPAAPPAVPRIARSPERIESMRLLERLRDEPFPEPPPPARARRRGLLWVVVLVVTALALLLALGVALYGPRLGLRLGTAATPSAVTAVAQTLERLPANRPVLVAYEWDGQRAGDLRPLEAAVLGALQPRDDIPVILLSTDPLGALLAAERAEAIRAAGAPIRSQYGLGYLNLGYRPGGPLALRRYADAFADLFISDAYGNPLRQNEAVMQRVCGGAVADCSWSKLGLLILIADDAEDVRLWFEQVRSAHPDLPVLLLTTEETLPYVQPFAALPQVQALAGVTAAQALAEARNVPLPASVARRADAVALGGVVWAALALLGAGPAYLAGRRQRRAAAEDEAWR